MIYNGKEDVFMKKTAKITAALAMMGLLAFVMIPQKAVRLKIR